MKVKRTKGGTKRITVRQIQSRSEGGWLSKAVDFIDDEEIPTAITPPPVDAVDDDDDADVGVMVQSARDRAERIGTTFHRAVYNEPPVYPITEPHVYDVVIMRVLVVSDWVHLPYSMSDLHTTTAEQTQGRAEYLMTWLINRQLALADLARAPPSPIFSVFQPRLKHNYPSDLRGQARSMLSTFYVEAIDAGSIVRCLKPAIALGYRYSLSTVDNTDYVNIFPSYSRPDDGPLPGSWVQFTGGEYVGDVGYVDSVSDPCGDRGRALVWAVPRLHLPPPPQPDLEGQHSDEQNDDDPQKRNHAESSVQPETPMEEYRYGRRPLRRPFDVNKVRELYGAEHVVEKDELYVFAGQCYRRGLIQLVVPVRDLDLRPRFSFSAFSAFGQSHIPDTAVQSYFWSHYAKTLRIGDRVKIIEGEQTDASAIVADITGDIALVVLAFVDLAIDVPVRALRRYFKPGDTVAVTAGVDQGKWGTVTSVVDEIVTLVSPSATHEVRYLWTLRPLYSHPH